MLILVSATSCDNGKNGSNGTYQPIETVVPARPAGQQDAVPITAPKLETVRV